MNLSLSPDDGRAFLMAIGLGIIVGSVFGGWIMSAIHKLIMAIVKMTLLGAVIVIGVFLWNHYQAASQTPRATPITSYETAALPTSSPTYQAPTVAPTPDRWWEQ